MFQNYLRYVECIYPLSIFLTLQKNLHRQSYTAISRQMRLAKPSHYRQAEGDKICQKQMAKLAFKIKIPQLCGSIARRKNVLFNCISHKPVLQPSIVRKKNLHVITMSGIYESLRKLTALYESLT